MKTKFLLIIGTVFAIAVGWNVAIYYRAYRAARTYQGQTMDQWLKKLATDPTAGTNVLKLRQVITGEEPDVITFEVPISYDLLEYGLKPYGIGKMNLLMDNEYVSHFTRATNGNCLFIWDTIYDRARLHHLQVELTLGGRSGTRDLVTRGPTFLFCTTNILQFDPFYSVYDEAHGAILYAKVPKTNATYSIELKTISGGHLKTITGSTTNGEIEAHWNLTDEHGNKVTNDSFNAVFNVTLPDGTSQTKSESGTRVK